MANKRRVKIPENKLPRIRQIGYLINMKQEELRALQMLSQSIMEETIAELKLNNKADSIQRTISFFADDGEIEIEDTPKIVTSPQPIDLKGNGILKH